MDPISSDAKPTRGSFTSKSRSDAYPSKLNPFSPSYEEPLIGHERSTNSARKDPSADEAEWLFFRHLIIGDDVHDDEIDKIDNRIHQNASSVAMGRKTKNYKQLTISVPPAKMNSVRAVSFADETKWLRSYRSSILDESSDYGTEDVTRPNVSLVSKSTKMKNPKQLVIFIPPTRYGCTAVGGSDGNESGPSASISPLSPLSWEYGDDRAYMVPKDSSEDLQAIPAENPFCDSCSEAQDDQISTTRTEYLEEYRAIAVENPFSDSNSEAEDDQAYLTPIVAYPTPKELFKTPLEIARNAHCDAPPRALEDPLSELDKNIVAMIFVGIKFTFYLIPVPDGKEYELMNLFIRENYPYAADIFDAERIKEVYQHLKVEKIARKYCDMSRKRLYEFENDTGLSCFVDRVKWDFERKEFKLEDD